MTISFVKRTSQSLLHKIPIPKRLCQKASIICPNRHGGMPSNGNLHDAEENWGWSVAVPTHILAACGLTLETGASGIRYHPLAPDSTIAVSLSSKIASLFVLIFLAVGFLIFVAIFVQLLI